MITKLICWLADVDSFGRKGIHSFYLGHIKDPGWVPNGWKCKFNPDHDKDIVDMAQNMLKCYETVMVFRVYFGVRTFFCVYFSRFKGVSTT